MTSGKKKTDDSFEPQHFALNELKVIHGGKKVRVVCLKCGKSFWSADKIRNRICEDCNKSNSHVTHRKCAVNSNDNYNLVYDDGGGM